TTGWSTTHKWYNNYDGTGDMRNINQSIDATDIATFLCGSRTIKNPKLKAGCAPPLLRDANGNYGYVSGNPTPFSRCIDIVRPASDENPLVGIDIVRNNILDITSKVTWQEKGSTKNTVLTERIYNWK
ncbi:MAG: hypothetical protein HYZ69_00350, partial [Candidatus Colwellbacteria bacterium]|nr:hypothetical protein [Candidatus Colwellbacteria bacterium]